MSKEKIITWEDIFELSKLVNNDHQLNKVSEYLKTRMEVIKVAGCYDPQSGWHGENVFLEGVNLSVNGYCYSVDNLMKHIDLFPSYQQTIQTDEYREYLRLKDKFKGLYSWR